MSIYQASEEYDEDFEGLESTNQDNVLNSSDAPENSSQYDDDDFEEDNSKDLTPEVRSKVLPVLKTGGFQTSSVTSEFVASIFCLSKAVEKMPSSPAHNIRFPAGSFDHVTAGEPAHFTARGTNQLLATQVPANCCGATHRHL